jgi:hypothetical protein
MSNTAKLYFSNKPFSNSNKGAKEAFKSDDHIYGRLEVPSTLQKFFKLPAISTKVPVPFLYYRVKVYPGKVAKADRQGHGDPNSWPFVRLSAEDLEKDHWNFDVLPEPAMATTISSGTSDFSSGKSCAPLSAMFTRERFPGDGEYTIIVKLAYYTYDPYDPTTVLAEDKWTNCQDEFTFQFSTSDLPKIQEDFQNATKSCQENARLKAMEDRGLPEQWNWKSEKITAGLTEDEAIALCLARESNSCECLKFVAFPVTGPMWMIEKDHLSMPVQKWHNQTLGWFARNNGRYFFIVGGLRQAYEGGGNYGPVYYQFEKSVELMPKYVEEAMKAVKPKASPGKTDKKEKTEKKPAKKAAKKK